MVIEFNRPVEATDSLMPLKLKEELPALLVKGNRAYLAAIEQYGNQGIWIVVPEYFKKTKAEMMQLNPVHAFLGSESVVLRSTAWCPERIFREAFFNWCKENNVNKPKWDKELYSTAFTTCKLVVSERSVTRMYKQKRISSRVVSGVDVILQEEGSGDFAGPDFGDDPGAGPSHAGRPGFGGD
eukprot:tig00021339_g20384.t1